MYVIVLAACGLTAQQAEAATPKCTIEDAEKAETYASSLKTWQEVFDSYVRYHQCDDAAIAEGYSSSVAALLATDWGHLGELLPLLKAHPDFERFVLRHLNETMSLEEDQQIKRNVQDACPKNAARFCAAVKKRLAESD